MIILAFLENCIIELTELSYGHLYRSYNNFYKDGHNLYNLCEECSSACNFFFLLLFSPNALK